MGMLLSMWPWIRRTGDGGCGYGIFGRNFLHVQVVFPAGAEEGDFDYGAEESASEP